MASENIGSMPGTRFGTSVILKKKVKKGSTCKWQDDGLERLPKRKADSLDFIFSFLDSKIYGQVYEIWVKLNEVNGWLSQQPRFSGNGSEVETLGLNLKVWMGE